MARTFRDASAGRTSGGDAARIEDYRVEHSDEGVAMSPADSAASAHPHVPRPDEPTVPELEDDEDVAPRPEEEIADALRAEPDTTDHAPHR